MKPNKFGLVMIHFNEFARLLGYSSWIDEKFYKVHGEFLRSFGNDELLERDLAYFYILRNQFGTILADSPEIPFLPEICCESRSKGICRTNSIEHKLTRTISRLSEFRDPVPEILIWHDIFIQLDTCLLKNNSHFKYALFELTRVGTIERTLDSKGEPMYSISKIPKKRGPGRPRKYS